MVTPTAVHLVLVFVSTQLLDQMINGQVECSVLVFAVTLSADYGPGADERELGLLMAGVAKDAA